MSDTSLLVTSPSVTDPSLAPAGRHTYYVLFPTPNLDPRKRDNLDWASLGPRYRDHIVATLEARGWTGFGDGIEVEHLTTPADWLSQGMAAGAPFAAAHTFAQTGPFRSAPVDRRIGNLVFAGSNTQPGVGVPMVLVSGRLAAERIAGQPRRPARIVV
jgi:phytoene desaturase